MAAERPDARPVGVLMPEAVFSWLGETDRLPEMGSCESPPSSPGCSQPHRTQDRCFQNTLFYTKFMQKMHHFPRVAGLFLGKAGSPSQLSI